MNASMITRRDVARLVTVVAEGLTAQDHQVTGENVDIVRQALAAKLLRRALDQFAHERIAAGHEALTEAEEDELARRVHARLFGLAELERLVSDDTIENVFANGAHQVFVRRAGGSKEQVSPIVDDDDALIELLRQAAATEGRTERRFDSGQPWVSLRLRDGSRLTAVRDVSGQPVFALRRHRHRHVDLNDLVRLGSISTTLRVFLAAAVRARLNILVCGGTDAGKTTLLRALASEIPADQRLVTVEDALELHLGDQPDRHPDVVELEAREANVEGQGEVSLRDLTRLALRLSPDRVIVGEARGPELLDMFQAMSQGNDGSLGTIHARSTADAFVQMLRYGMRSPERLTAEAVAVDIAASLDLVIHVQRLPHGDRAVSSVREIVGFEGQHVLSNEVFSDRDGRAWPSGTPLRDSTLDQLIAAGFDPAVMERPDGGWS